MQTTDPSTELGPFQIALLTLSVVLLAGLAAEMLLPLPREVGRLVLFLDTAVCVVLLVDFFQRLLTAPSKWRFLRWGWIDLLASVPAVEALRWGRVFRIVRVVRLIVALRSLHRLFGVLFVSRRKAGLASLLVLTFLVVAFASTGVLLAERVPEANIHTAEDALWWAMTTITTVGYGDRYPVTNIGRVIASVLMFSGIGLFGALSGVAASFFMGDGKRDATPAGD
jgi:voltage-gated potassium channel